MIKKLEYIRNYINKIDDNILKLIEKRFKKINIISKIKKKYKIPSYIYEREKDILYDKLYNKNKNNLSNNFIKNLFKLLINESYKIENKNILIKNKKLKLLIINSKNNSIFSLKIQKIFGLISLIEEIYFKNINNIKLENIKNFDFIILNIPKKYLYFILNIINKNKKCIIIDSTICNNNNYFLNEIYKYCKNTILKISFQYDYDIDNITKENLLIYYKRLKNKDLWIIEQFKLWGINIIEIKEKNLNYFDLLYKNNLIKKINMILYFMFLNDINFNIDMFYKYSSFKNKQYIDYIKYNIFENINFFYENINCKKYKNIFFNYIIFIKKIFNIIYSKKIKKFYKKINYLNKKYSNKI